MVIPRWLIPLVIIICLTAGLFWFFTRASWLKVKSISIEGEATADVKQEIEKLRGQNILWLSVTHPDEVIRRQQPGIKQIQILRGIPDTLKIKLIERDPAVLWQSGDSLYTLDPYGFVFKSLVLSRNEAGELIFPGEPIYRELPLIVDMQNLPVKIGQTLVRPAHIIFIQELKNRLPKEFNLKFERVQINETIYNISVVTDAGWSIHFDTTRQLDPQLRTLTKVLESKRQDVKEYVDVRVRGWVYIK